MQKNRLFLQLNRGQLGFTLVELMIVVFIISVLSAIAYPSYLTYTQKARRAEAPIALTQAAARQENWFARNLYYALTMDAGFLNFPTDPYITPDGNYSVTTSGGAGYTITATAQGKQFEDLPCRTFTLDNTGLKGSLNSVGTPSTAICWK